MFFDFKLLPNLPEYNGPYRVGAAEYELATSTLSPDLRSGPVPTVKFQLFYPTTCHDASSRNLTWLPQPQDAYVDGYLKLGKVGPWVSTLIQRMSWWVKLTTVPAYCNAEVDIEHAPYRVLVFSHGLVGGINTHSAILGELASHGIVCVAVEHRDGSAPVTLVRDAGDSDKDSSGLTGQPRFFQSISLKIKPGVLEQRDQQLRTRLFELMAVYRSLELLNEGQLPRNLAGHNLTFPKGCLDLRPGRVAWSGHSFGGATIVQFLKSVFYTEETAMQSANPLLSVQPSPSLTDQILPSSPFMLLDPWFMPLKSATTNFLYTKPLPCHTDGPKEAATACAVLSSEFAWHWPECHSHMPAILSADPPSIEVQTEEEYDRMMLKYSSPRMFINDSKRDEVRYKTLLSTLRQVASPHFETYVLRDTTHTTLTDFGILFPWVSYYFTGQRRPQAAIENIVRCMLRAIDRGECWDRVPTDLVVADAQLEKVS